MGTKKGVLGHFFGVLVVLAGIVAPGTLAADPCSELAPVRSLRRLAQTSVEYLHDLQSTKLTPNDRASGDSFGGTVPVDGDTIVIGASSGSAYVFTRDTAGDLASGWTQVAKLTADDGASGDSFGGTVSIDGDKIVIRGGDSTSWYTFTRDTAGDLASG